MGIVSALGAGIAEHRNVLVDARTGLAPQTFFEGKHATEFICGMAPPSALPLSIEETAANRANLLLDIACKEALSVAKVQGSCKADIVVGTTAGNFHGGTLYYKQKRNGAQPDNALVAGFMPASVADCAAEKNGIAGKRFTVSSACASATTAIGHAFRMIASGRSSMVCAGGVDALCPFIVAGFNSLRLLSKTPCMPFDEKRCGFNPGEGAAILVLESAESADLRGVRPIAYVNGFGEALEAFHHTKANPNGSGVARALSMALSRASIAPHQVDHVHLHGTATIHNDISEYNGLRSVFGGRLESIPVCSTKSTTGHTLGAAGGLSAVFAILSLESGIVPATLFHQTLDPQFAGLSVSPVPRNAHVRRAAMTSLGFGGEVACLLFEGSNT
jgi:3-oxoacyl-(acyl-carrier-protein) synthase